MLPQVRGRGPFGSPGGLVTDWNLMTSLEGLFAAGSSLFAANYYHHAAATGRYAGRKAAEYALARGGDRAREERAQVAAEMERVYAPVRRTAGVDWKELRAGLARVMQNYCGDLKNAELLRIGRACLEEVEERVFPETHAANPHQLMRVLESMNYLYCDDLILRACEERRASSRRLGFSRQDFPSEDPPEWHRFVAVRQGEGGVVRSRLLELGFWGDLADGYRAHNRDYAGLVPG
jgi:succinate dehydrogenase/fumarate reductase flavoprotein subunit